MTRSELARLGIQAERVDVAYNGTTPRLPTSARRSPTPRLCVLGRLVPHKRVEHALEVARRLRRRWPDLTVSVIGTGWWAPRLFAAAQQLGVDDITEFHGYVNEQTKHDELARCWLMLTPSLKEGWGLVVHEAAQHYLPTVGYRSAGGLAESIVDGKTGVLVDDLDGLTGAVDALLADHQRREALGSAAAQHADRFTWAQTIHHWNAVLGRVCDP
jgi:glycosyltransferase involved in cell wall biosynthesis